MEARALAALVLALVAAGCGEAPVGDAPPFAPFTVRGRLPDPAQLAVRVEDDGTPMEPGRLADAVYRALMTWTGTGPVRFRPATPGDAGVLVFAWRRGAHDACAAFGTGPERAHAGPVAPESFVHFDAERAWDDDALYRDALHELGHVLGLGHGDAPGSAMQPDPSADVSGLADADRCGLHSLYGGGVDRPGDLRVVREGVEVAPTLRQVAPPGRSEHALFDTDGDGDDELCVWRTDRLGQGTLLVYHFAPGPRLERTIGPLYGATTAAGRAGFVRTENGARLFVTELDDGRRIARAFDERGLFSPAAPPEPPGPDLQPRRRGDLDGDGALEDVLFAP